MEEFLNYLKVASNMILALIAMLFLGTLVTDVFMLVESSSKVVRWLAGTSIVLSIVAILFSILDYEDRVRKAGQVYIERVNQGAVHYGYVLSRLCIVISTVLVIVGLIVMLIGE